MFCSGSGASMQLHCQVTGTHTPKGACSDPTAAAPCHACWCGQHRRVRACLVRAANRDEHGLVGVLLEVPRLDALLAQQRFPMPGGQEEHLHQEDMLRSAVTTYCFS